MKTFQATLLVLIAACAATPVPKPQVLAETLVADLEAGHESQAAKSFEPVADDEEYRELIYPVVFAAARENYEQGEGARSVALLRFLVDQFPKAASAREALVYALFLQRAGSTEPDEDANEELEEHLAVLRERDLAANDFVYLIAVQAAIDSGDLAAARGDLDRFLTDWDGHPPELLAYVEDLARYLSTQPGGQ